MTSDGGVRLLAATDRKPGLMDAAAHCIADPRSPQLIKCDVVDMLSQRVCALVLGWEDFKDYSALRRNVVWWSNKNRQPDRLLKPKWHKA